VVQRLLSLHVVPLATGVPTQLPLTGLQLSAVQTLPSSQATGVPPQVPAVHRSFVVQRLLSLQVVPLTTGVLLQTPVAGLHESVVQELLSVHGIGVLEQTPARQASVVQALPSLHGVEVSGVCVHPRPGTQASVVQALPSSQLMGVPAHVPATQVSFAVQSWPSLHVTPLGTNWQAAVQQPPPSHASPGSTMWSPQRAGVQSVRQAPGVVSLLLAPLSHSSPQPGSTTPLPQASMAGTHAPAAVQVSPEVQGSPSSQVVPAPAAGAQSAVQQMLVSSHASPLSVTPSPHRGGVQSVRQESGAVSEFPPPLSHTSNPSSMPSPQTGGRTLDTTARDCSRRTPAWLSPVKASMVGETQKQLRMPWRVVAPGHWGFG
jgi:hypothetical protein